MLINEMASVCVCVSVFSLREVHFWLVICRYPPKPCCLLKGTLMYIFASHNATLSKCGGLCISFVTSVLSFLTSNLEMQVLTNSSVHFLTSHQRNYYSCNSIRTHTVFHYTTWWASTEPAAAVSLAQAFINLLLNVNCSYQAHPHADTAHLLSDVVASICACCVSLLCV